MEMTNEQTLVAVENQSQRKAFVVEDDQIIVTILEHLLTRRGYAVDIARDGRQATQYIDATETAPELVLLDVMLPYVDGFELIRKIREHATWHQVPVIMLTSKSQEHDIVRALDNGANDYIVKPFRPREVLARIRLVTKSS